MRGLVIAIVVAGTAIATAEPARLPEAGELFQRAHELAKLGQVTEACALFARSYELEAALGTAVNLADCLEHAGKAAPAWALFDLVARGSQNVKSRARLARARADALLARLATVIVTVHDASAAGLAIRLGDRGLPPAAELRVVIEPGEVELIATAPGRRTFATKVSASAGATVTIDLPALVAADEPAATRRQRSRVYVAAGLGAAGIAGLGGSLGLAIASRRAYDRAFGRGCARTASGVECIAHTEGAALNETAGRRADLATWLAVGGAVMASAAIVVFFTAPGERVQLSPIASHEGLGVALAGRF
jgi:tetratricopeptide (TPR) repeat protein